MQKRAKTGGRIALPPELKTKVRRISNADYELLQALKQRSGLMDYVKFITSSWNTDYLCDKVL